jgi:hypothetical protein
MTEDKIQRLRDAGISEDVIIDMMKKPEEGRSEGYIDPATPSSTFTQAQTAGAPVAGPETSMTQLGAEAATLIPDALKYAGGGALGLYAAKKIGDAMSSRTPATPVQPVQPTTFTGGANPAFDKALSKPPAGPGIVQQGMDIARRMQEVAASRVAPATQALAPIARAATGVGAALMPGNMGQNYPFPQSGPMRGQEINPATGRPWTPAELQQYNTQFQ